MRLSPLILLPLAAAGPVARRSEPAPLITREVDADMADKYIVKFKEGSAMSVVQDALKNVAESTHVYDGIFQGFAAKLDSVTLELLRFLPDVST
jgi:transcription antitermination factor NusG